MCAWQVVLHVTERAAWPVLLGRSLQRVEPTFCLPSSCVAGQSAEDRGREP